MRGFGLREVALNMVLYAVGGFVAYPNPCGFGRAKYMQVSMSKAKRDMYYSFVVPFMASNKQGLHGGEL